MQGNNRFLTPLNMLLLQLIQNSPVTLNGNAIKIRLRENCKRNKSNCRINRTKVHTTKIYVIASPLLVSARCIKITSMKVLLVRKWSYKGNKPQSNSANQRVMHSGPLMVTTNNPATISRDHSMTILSHSSATTTWGLLTIVSDNHWEVLALLTIASGHRIKYLTCPTTPSLKRTLILPHSMVNSNSHKWPSRVKEKVL